MIEATSNAGPFRVGIDQALDPGETVRLDFRQIEAGPNNKEGWLTKWFGARAGMDFIQVTSTTDLPVRAESNGGVNRLVPGATTVTISGTGPDGEAAGRKASTYSFVRVTNESSSIIDAGDVEVSTGNLSREEEEQQGQRVFDPLTMIPGVNRG